MRLKEIKPGMVIHCKTQEEANMLCNAVGAEEKWKEYWVNYKYNTCYHIAHNGIYEYGMSSAFKGEKITEFSDLILPELTAEETLRIFGAICAGDGCSRCPFDIIKDDSDCPTFLLEHYKEAAEICAQWKSDNEKKEPEIEWVYRVFGAENYGEKFFQTEEEAIKRCEELAKSQKTKQYARYERVCRVKAVE